MFNRHLNFITPKAFDRWINCGGRILQERDELVIDNMPTAKVGDRIEGFYFILTRTSTGWDIEVTDK